MMSSYLAMIHGIDQAVGEILLALDANGFGDNTVVLLMSDNGAFVGERGFAGKWLAYEPSIRVPLIICDLRPGTRTRGATAHQMVLNIDLPETILDLAEVEIPSVMQGRSLAPLLQGESPLGAPTRLSNTRGPRRRPTSFRPTRVCGAMG